MNLIKEMMDDCILMNKSKVSDGEGGFTVEWTEGAQIKAAIILDQTMQARIAEKQGVSSVFTITTSKANALEFHDVLKRVKDGKIFRVTSDKGDKESPNVSSLDISQVIAEKWELT